MKGIALVTGAGRGIGRAVALALAADGWHVVASGRDEAALGEVVAAGAAESLVLDVTDPAAVDAAFAAIEQRHGRLDLLFNNAGVAARGVPLDVLDVDEWRHVVDVNLTGAFLCLRAAFRLMKAQDPQGGRIINNGSISATVPRPG